jgi:hypothetical protein
MHSSLVSTRTDISMLPFARIANVVLTESERHFRAEVAEKNKDTCLSREQSYQAYISEVAHSTLNNGLPTKSVIYDNN